MSQTHANDLQPTGALIAADDVEIHTVGSTTNSGVIKGGTKTVLTATDILNRGGTISSSATNGATQVVASNDVVNSSGMITGNRVAVSAGGISSIRLWLIPWARRAHQVRARSAPV
jgi:filamentous hemagglutinin